MGTLKDMLIPNTDGSYRVGRLDVVIQEHTEWGTGQPYFELYAYKVHDYWIGLTDAVFGVEIWLDIPETRWEDLGEALEAVLNARISINGKWRPVYVYDTEYQPNLTGWKEVTV